VLLHLHISPNYDSNNVSVINTTTNTVTATVDVGNNPMAFGQFISGRMIPAQGAALTLKKVASPIT
jgi:uncharacterized repeat protein (TIGR01451 family)